jgi:hypothetical protein
MRLEASAASAGALAAAQQVLNWHAERAAAALATENAEALPEAVSAGLALLAWRLGGAAALPQGGHAAFGRLAESLLRWEAGDGGQQAAGRA